MKFRPILSCFKSKLKGFSMSEILVALGILGVIYTISLPLMATERDTKTKRAIFRETIAMMDTILRKGMASDELTSGDNKYFLDRMNTVKTCWNDSTAEGCWTHAAPGDTLIAPSFETVKPGVVLHNGVTITGFSGGGDLSAGMWEEGILIDWNGPKPPNQDGDDQLYVAFCFGDTDCTIAATTIQAGAIRPVQQGSANNTALFNYIFTD